MIASKHVFEFDFVGCFNNMKLSNVAENLFKFGVPKFMVIHLLNLSASDITNIGRPELKKLLESKVWKSHWDKHEYIHKYRRN